MVLFPSSIFMLLLGIIFSQSPPKDINYFYGFRTKKSMKNQKNWKEAQTNFGKYTKKVFSYNTYFSLTTITLDIIAIIIKKDNLLIWSTIIQSLILCFLLFYIYYKVNKRLI